MRLIRAGRKERVRRYHLLFLITLMSLNVFVFIHQLKGCGVAAIESLYFYTLSITTSKRLKLWLHLPKTPRAVRIGRAALKRSTSLAQKHLKNTKYLATV